LELARLAGDLYYCQLRNFQISIRIYRKCLYNSKKKKVRKVFFENIGNNIIAANRQKKPIIFTADIFRIQSEKKKLAEFEFKNRNTADITAAILFEKRIRLLELRLQLEKLQISRELYRKIDFGKSEIDRIISTKIEEPIYIDWKNKTGLEYPVCIGIPILDPAIQIFFYSRKNSLQRYFESYKLLLFFGYSGRYCDIPEYSFICILFNGYKTYLKKYHLISL